MTHFHCTVAVEAVKPRMVGAATPMAAATAVFVVDAVNSIITVAIAAAALGSKVVMVGLLSSSRAAMVELAAVITRSAIAARGLGASCGAAEIIEEVAIKAARTKSQTRLECLNCSRIAAKAAKTVAAIKVAVVGVVE